MGPTQSCPCPSSLTLWGKTLKVITRDCPLKKREFPNLWCTYVCMYVCMYVCTCYTVCTFLYPATTHAEEVVKGHKSDLEELANDPSMRIPPYCLPSADLPPLLPFYPEGILEKVVHWFINGTVYSVSRPLMCPAPLCVPHPYVSHTLMCPAPLCVLPPFVPHTLMCPTPLCVPPPYVPRPLMCPAPLCAPPPYVSHTLMCPAPLCVPHPYVPRPLMCPTPLCVPHPYVPRPLMCPTPLCVPHPYVVACVCPIPGIQPLEPSTKLQKAEGYDSTCQ